jgi:cupin 2 domain-containing protein
MGNIFSSLPDKLEHESFEELLHYKNIKIERIVSHGHTSPENGWYDQKENEWVPAHAKHKVTRTDPDGLTIWLAIHYW